MTDRYGPEEAQRDLRSEWQEKNKAAFEMISNLCRPTTDPKHRDWIMSIPARENHDPDIVIGSALRAAAAYIRELEKRLSRYDNAPNQIQGDACPDCGGTDFICGRCPVEANR